MKWLPPVAVALVLVVFVPSLESAFHTPKLVVLGLAVLLSLPSVYTNWRRLPVLVLVFIGAVGLSATLSQTWSAPSTAVLLIGATALAVFSTFDFDAKVTARVIGLSLAVVCGLALLQAFGLFTFGASGRMTRSSTLGSPDFVASVVGAAAWLCWPLERRWLALLGALAVLTLAVTQSFASLLSFGAAATVALGLRAGPRRWSLLGAAFVLTVLALGVSGRELATSARGRWYLTQVALPHVLDAPLTGLGPGAVELHWSAWELELWTKRCGDDAACVQAHPDFAFNGLQDHVHDDWLELWLEVGPVGLGALALWLAMRVWKGATSPFAAAGLIALITRATVDFPLHRPADWAVLSLLCLAVSVEHNGTVAARPLIQ